MEEAGEDPEKVQQCDKPLGQEKICTLHLPVSVMPVSVTALLNGRGAEGEGHEFEPSEST